MDNGNFQGKSPRNWMISWVLLILAAGMMLYGLIQGEAEAVLRKAVRICLECIGIG